MGDRSRRRVGVAVPAAGAGRRMGGRRKPWLELCGRPILAHTLTPFLSRSDVVAVAVALPPDDAAAPPPWLAALDPRIRIVAGGDTRATSVGRAVRALPADVEVILVHDAARPLVPPPVIERVVTVAAAGEGAVAGLPLTDTLKRVDGDRRVVETPPRAGLWRAQTPQGFPADLLRRAVDAMDDDPDRARSATDDAALVEAVGGRVVMVPGAPRNLKVTHPTDLPLAGWYLDHPDQGAA